MTISGDKAFEAVDNIVKMLELKKRQITLFNQMADTLTLRAAYNLSMKGGASFCIIDESLPMRSRVDNRGYGKGKYGVGTTKFPIRHIKGIAKIKIDGMPEIEDDLLEFQA